MIKKIGYIILVIFSLFIAAAFIGMIKFHNAIFKEKPNYLRYTYEPKPITFNWVNDTIEAYVETKIAMVIPLKIEGLSHKFYVQFDTGSPYTFIYEKDLESLKSFGLNIKEVVNEEGQYVQDLDFELGGNRINASMIKILENYGNTFDQSDTTATINMGTIGSDFMDNRITVIDFKNQYIQFYDERPPWMTDLPDFASFDFKGRRFMLPAIIDVKRFELFYDSGCSAFGLITTKNRFEDYTNINSEEISYNANRWGDALPIHHKATDQKMTIGHANLGLERISYVDMYADIQRFVTPFTRVGGWLGNKPFLESTLILDTQKQEFIVLNKS